MTKIHRRHVGQLAGGVAALSVLGGGHDAHAGPMFWAAARWAGRGILSWLLDAALAEGFDRLKAFLVERDEQNRLRVAGTPTAVRLGDRIEAGRLGERLLPIDNCLFSAFRAHNVSLSDAFTHWGRPTESWNRRVLSDGYLIGQWWEPYNADRRYVVTRTFDSGRAFHYLAFRERSGASEVAQEVIRGAEPSRPRMKTLVNEPHRFVQEAADRPSA